MKSVLRNLWSASLAGLEAGAGTVQGSGCFELFRAGGLAFKAGSGFLGSFEFGFGRARIDAAAELGGVDQYGHFVGIDFGKTTHQGDGGPTVAITQAHHAGFEGGEHGDVAGKDAHLTSGAGQDDLVGNAIELTDAGLLDRRLSANPIPWDTISWKVIFNGRSYSLQMNIAEPARSSAGIAWPARALGLLSKLLRQPEFAIAALGS